MQMINKSLPRHLKRNMEPPALQYRGIGNRQNLLQGLLILELELQV